MDGRIRVGRMWDALAPHSLPHCALPSHSTAPSNQPRLPARCCALQLCVVSCNVARTHSTCPFLRPRVLLRVLPEGAGFWGVRAISVRYQAHPNMSTHFATSHLGLVVIDSINILPPSLPPSPTLLFNNSLYLHFATTSHYFSSFSSISLCRLFSSLINRRLFLYFYELSYLYHTICRKLICFLIRIFPVLAL